MYLYRPILNCHLTPLIFLNTIELTNYCRNNIIYMIIKTMFLKWPCASKYFIQIYLFGVIITIPSHISANLNHKTIVSIIRLQFLTQYLYSYYVCDVLTGCNDQVHNVTDNTVRFVAFVFKDLQTWCRERFGKFLITAHYIHCLRLRKSICWKIK